MKFLNSDIVFYMKLVKKNYIILILKIYLEQSIIRLRLIEERHS
jgi:hypothetical protein